MALLGDEDREILLERFREEMDAPVELLFFSRQEYQGAEIDEFPDEMPGEDQDLTPQACAISYRLYREITELSPKLTLTFVDLATPEGFQKALETGLDPLRLPAMAFQAESLTGKSRFFGIPTGYEFATLIENITDLSRNLNHLKAETQATLAALTGPAEIKVFVTPTCSFCPSAVRMAHQMAMSSPHITAEVIEANEFQDLTEQYNVYGVPKIIVNDRVEFEGAVPEKVFLGKVLAATTN
jgi:glutaredoxin-like protein